MAKSLSICRCALYVALLLSVSGTPAHGFWNKRRLGFAGVIFCAVYGARWYVQQHYQKAECVSGQMYTLRRLFENKKMVLAGTMTNHPPCLFCYDPVYREMAFVDIVSRSSRYKFLLPVHRNGDSPGGAYEFCENDQRFQLILTDTIGTTGHVYTISVWYRDQISSWCESSTTPVYKEGVMRYVSDIFIFRRTIWRPYLFGMPKAWQRI